MNLGFITGLKGNWKELGKLDWKRWKEVREEQNREGKEGD